MSKLSKLDIQMAVSTVKIKLPKKFFCRNVYYDVVAHVPNFQLSARSSSFFSAVFPSLSWTLFFWRTRYQFNQFVNQKWEKY